MERNQFFSRQAVKGNKQATGIPPNKKYEKEHFDNVLETITLFPIFSRFC